MKKPKLLAITLLILILLVLIWNRSGSSSQSTEQKSHGNTAKAQAGGMADPVNHGIRAIRQADPNWIPPVEFSELSAPFPQIPVQRGQHARRHYSYATTMELDAKLATRPASIMAMTPEDGRLYLNAEETDVHTLVARRMVFNPAALDAVVAQETSRILAPTTDDEVLTLEIHKVKSRSDNSHTLMGRVAGEPELSDVQLVYHEGVIHGTVARYDKQQHLEYRILSDGHMMVRELDTSTMVAKCGNNPSTENSEPPCSHEGNCGHKNTEAAIEAAVGEDVQIIPSTETEPAPSTPAAETAGYTTIDIVVGYDQGARIADGGYSQIEARIIASIDRMNTAFGNSQITNTEIMLLGTIEDPYYVFGGSAVGQGDELTALNSKTDGILDTVTDYSTQLGSDLVAFVMQDADDSAGLANLPGSSSVTARTYMTSNAITFAHEVGHNLGCNHGWGDGDQAFNSNYGWRFQTTGGTKVRTIMAYDWDWQRIPHFSNPSVSYGGVATGAVDGFDVRTQPLADQRYLKGGYTGPDMNLFGFNGTNATLGANNAEVILSGVGSSSYGAAYAAARATRTSSVINPIAGANWSTGSTQLIYFAGGDYSDTANIDLYKGGVFHSNLATGLDPATSRRFSWTLPTNLVTGSDYTIRITLNLSGGGTTTLNSSQFSITNMPANTVAILSPNGGENFTMGVSTSITWVSALGSNVKIELLKGGTSVRILAANEADDGHFSWVVPLTLSPGNDYKIRISSVNNASYFDDSNSNFTIAAPPNAISMPYAESFETGLGNWSQSTSDDLDWTRRSGGTPSADTGPTAAYHGSFYLYTEASDGYNKTFVIESWLNLIGAAGPELTFNYHMLDATPEANYMGTLELQLSTDGVNWITLFTRSKNQGSAWLAAAVDLSPYAGQYVKLRFKGTTGGWYPSDMCIDNLAITDHVELDRFEISSIGSPQTVGQAINGITITAKTPTGLTMTDFTGTVTFGGTAGITGTSGNFTSGVLSGVSLTPTASGLARTLTVTDGASHEGSVSFDVQSAHAPVATTGNYGNINLTQGGGGSAVTGAFHEWNAAADTPGDSTWSSQTSNAYNWTFDGGALSPASVTDARFSSVTKAYVFPNAVDAANSSFDAKGSTQPATFEFILDVDAADGSIFETGGSTNGLQVDVVGGFLRGTVAGPLSRVQYELTATDLGRFIHVVFVVDPVNDVLRLYVDGSLKAFTEWTGTDWSGTNNAALGATSGSQPSGGATANFTGKMALFRFYSNKALDASEVQTNFNAAVGSSVTLTLAGSASDEDGGSLSSTWSLVSGPGSVVFGNASSPTSTVTFTTAGTYTLRLTVSDGMRVTTSDVEIVVTDFTPYELWASTSGINEDSNGDGIPNGIAWVLGASNKNENAIDKLPTHDNTSEPEYLIFTYRRSDAANDDPNTTIAAEYSEALGGWTNATHDGSNIIISETNDIVPGVDEVKVKIKKSLSNSGKLFCRLKVVIAE